MTPQLFQFKNNQSVRTLRDEQGNTWFIAKDVCDALGYKKAASAVVEMHCKPKGTTKLVVPSAGGKQRTLLINESNLYRLIAHSDRPEAEAFEEWIYDEVLPSIRKTGSYSLKALILPQPCQWERTYPQEFMRQAMRLYNKPYDPRINTPQFIGKFINKYVYGGLDRNATAELKVAQQNWRGQDEMAFLHQFLNSDGRTALKDHLISLVTLMKGSPDINHFDQQFTRVFRSANQLELYLR